MTVLKPFKELLLLGKEAINAIQAPLKAFAKQKEFELEMAKLDEEIARKESEVQNACSNPDVKPIDVINKLDDLAILSRRKGQYERILKEMFPS